MPSSVFPETFNCCDRLVVTLTDKRQARVVRSVSSCPLIIRLPNVVDFFTLKKAEKHNSLNVSRNGDIRVFFALAWNVESFL